MQFPAMPDEPRNIRKVVSFASSEWKAIDDFRFAQRISTESEAIRRLIELGLEAARKPPIP